MILFYFNESGKTGFTLMILIKQSMILFTFILEFSILVAVWGTTKIRLKGNLFYGPDIRIKNTPKIQTNVGKMK
jgi:hypothetical protein